MVGRCGSRTTCCTLMAVTMCCVAGLFLRAKTPGEGLIGTFPPPTTTGCSDIGERGRWEWTGIACMPNGSLPTTPFCDDQTEMNSLLRARCEVGVHRQPCAAYRRGAWHWAPGRTSCDASSPVSFMDSVRDRQAVPRVDTRCRADVNDTACTVSKPIVGTELIAALTKGRRRVQDGANIIVLLGDSLMRQIFLTFVSLGRADPTPDRQHAFVEHYFHLDASWVVFSNGTDELRVFAASREGDPCACDPLRRPSETVVAVCYCWDPFGIRAKYGGWALENAASLVLLPPLHVYGRFTTKRQPPTAGFVSSTFQFATNVIEKSIGLSLQPPHLRGESPLVLLLDNPLFGGNSSEHSKLFDTALSQRNLLAAVAVRRWRRSGVKAVLLSLSASLSGAAREDGLHFSCTYTPFWPQAVAQMKNHSGDCRSPANALIASSIAHSLAAMP